MGAAPGGAGGWRVSEGGQRRQLRVAIARALRQGEGRNPGHMDPIMHAAWLWAAFTLVAAGAQTLRNATQRELTASLGAVGATQVRFVFGLPFAILFLAGVSLWTGLPLPALEPSVLAWTALGAMAQIAATALMLAAMDLANFVVVTAYIKTEAVQVAIFALAFLGERPSPSLVAAIGLATAGVLILSLPKAGAGRAGAVPAALLGLVSAAFFALAAVGFKAAVTGLATPAFAMAASVVLVAGLAMQSFVLAIYLLVADRAGATAILVAWRASLLAGFLGALASQFWFLAFALASPARVRTLALVEVLFAQAIALLRFRERLRPLQALGMALVVLGVIALIDG